jgi:hypothetical protein
VPAVPDPVTARKTWRTLEPIHGAIYFAPEAVEAYAALGIEGTDGYFASRAAAMGPVGADVVVATFFNFCPDLVRHAVPTVWAIAEPEQILAARLDAAGRMLRRALDTDGTVLDADRLAEAATLARRAATEATRWPEGRPLFAGHAGLDWPDDPLLVLWHAQTLLREFRGDGHIAAMTAEGVDGVEALILHAATGEVPSSILKASRQWPDDEWSAGQDRLRARGWLDADGGLTDDGRAHRRWVEDRTDALAAPAYTALGEDGCARLRELCRPWSKAIVESGGLGFAGARSR